MGVDPVSGNLGNPQWLNRFASVHNDPVNWIDSDGKQAMPHYTVKVVHPAPFEFSLQVNGFSPFAPTEMGPVNFHPQSLGNAVAGEFVKSWVKYATARTAATNEMQTDEKCRDFLQQILDWGKSHLNIGEVNGVKPDFSIESLTQALDHASIGFETITTQDSPPILQL